MKEQCHLLKVLAFVPEKKIFEVFDKKLSKSLHVDDDHCGYQRSLEPRTQTN